MMRRAIMAVVAAWMILAFADLHPASAVDCTHFNCDDNNACTTDGCDETTGCFHKSVSCDDNLTCTGDGCDPTSGCVHEPICMLGAACTGNSPPQCVGGLCNGGVCVQRNPAPAVSRIPLAGVGALLLCGGIWLTRKRTRSAS